MNSIEFEKENQRLNQTIAIIDSLLKEEKIDLQKLYKDFIGSREDLWLTADRIKLHISNLEVALDKPYFARIDFTSEEDGKTNVIYIGKNGIIQNTDVVVTDWRAPISSLYYDAEIGDCSFEAPDGIIKGNMSLKRQFDIESGKLKDYFDVDLVSNDTLLQKYLNSNNDSRLKSIVSTIQKEQNEVIRRNINENIIIQGVAGSGKTTVALHRIAYLVYNYIDSIRQNQYLVIGPNPVFLKYIKSVLPELDVNGVGQYTYESFAKMYINEDFSINFSNTKIVDSIDGKRNNSIDKFKCSMKYKDMLEKFIQFYFCCITNKPLMIGDFEVISSDKIESYFNSTKSNLSTDLSSRIELTIDRICSYLEENRDSIISRYNNYSFELFKTAKTEEEKNIMRKMFVKDKNELLKNCRSSLRKYFNKYKVSATKLYKLFINSICDFDVHDFDRLNELKKETLKNLKTNSYDFEDIAALLYLKSFISPNKEFYKIKHVVIDEAQDFGEFNFYSLKRVLPSSTFSIFGDLAQSIYDYRAVNNWDAVNDSMFANKGNIINFNKSYRTTAEIMDVADDIAQSIGLGRSELVVRHGNEVKFTKMQSKEKITKYIVQKISQYKQKGYKTIAIISKTDSLSNCINQELYSLGIDIPNVSESDDLSDEKFKICTISNQLAKGLEFDAVIINNANEETYSHEKNLDMKLLYVAVSRALHELDIVYSGNLTKPLENHLKKNISNQKVLKR